MLISFKKILNGVKGVLASILGGGQTVFGLVLNIPDIIMTALGFMPPKKLRLRVWQLLDESGGLVGRESQIQNAIDYMATVLKDQVNVSVVSASGPILQLLADPVPDTALTPECGSNGLLKNLFGEAGTWFRKWSAGHLFGSTLGIAAPVTVYVVDEVTGSHNGCSVGVLGDFALVDRKGVLATSNANLLTMVHEVGHSCSLFWHWDNTIMDYANQNRAPTFNRLQRISFRSSKHVWFF